MDVVFTAKAKAIINLLVLRRKEKCRQPLVLNAVKKFL